jgi:hypothetical protein
LNYFLYRRIRRFFDISTFLKKITEKLKSIKIRNKILKRVLLSNDLENLFFTDIFAGFTENLIEIKILSYFKQNLNEIQYRIIKFWRHYPNHIDIYYGFSNIGKTIFILYVLKYLLTFCKHDKSYNKILITATINKVVDKFTEKLNY